MKWFETEKFLSEEDKTSLKNGESLLIFVDEDGDYVDHIVSENFSCEEGEIKDNLAWGRGAIFVESFNEDWTVFAPGAWDGNTENTQKIAEKAIEEWEKR